MRRPFVAGNWKMHGTCDGAAVLLDAIRQGTGVDEAVETVVCPPFCYLESAADRLRGSAVALGAQNLAREAPGAFTGEIAGEMLRDVGCRYVIVGHSERRALYGEDDAMVAGKLARALEVGLAPILCVGESLAERDAGRTEEVVGRQLAAVLDEVGDAGMAGLVIAYEPVWAIGTGRTASPEQAQTVHRFIRARLAPESAAAVRIVYGGSVKAANAGALFAMPDIDGGLIGGAALDAGEFLAVREAARPS